MGRRAGALALLFALPLACSRRAELEKPAAHGTRLLLVALDGFDPGVAATLLAEGKLPHLRRLIENGSQATLTAQAPLLSPILWTTVATGLPAERHGIVDWTIEGKPVSSVHRRVPAFWNLLPRFHRQVATVGWLATWPAESAAGTIISERSHYARLERSLAPRGAIDLLQFRREPIDIAALPRFTDAAWNPAALSLPESDSRQMVQYLLHNRLLLIHQRDSFYSDLAVELLGRERFDLAAIYLRGADYVGHGFWQFWEPQPFASSARPVAPELARSLGAVVPRYYSFLDEQLGRIVAAAGPRADVLLLSDHGFLADPELLVEGRGKGLHLSGNHRPEAFFLVSGPSFRNGVNQQREIGHLDILPTLARILEIPISAELPGRVLEEYLAPELLARPARTVSAYPGLAGREERQRPEEGRDEQLLEELRSLGYIK